MGGGVKPIYLINAIQCWNLKHELGISNEETVILSVGEVNKNKNHKVVIDALQYLAGCCYVICGCGPLMKEHRKRAEKIGVESHLILAGYRNDVDVFYKMADMFIFPSKREGLPVSLIEAMSSGLPCAAAYNRGSRDLIDDNELLFDGDNIESTIHAINKLQGMRPVIYNLDEYNITNITDKMIALYSCGENNP